MVSPRAEELKIAVGYDNWPRNDVGDDRLFVRNHQIGVPAVEGWKVVSARRNRLPDGVFVSRINFENPTTLVDDLLLVESYECPARQVARDALLEQLANFHLQRSFSQVPDPPGGVVLVDEGEANALVVIGNLMVRLSSGGEVAVPVRSISEQLVAQIAARPKVSSTSRAMAVPEHREVEVGESTRVGLSTPAMSEFAEVEGAATVKLFARCGEIRAVDDDLVFDADETGHGTIECYSKGSGGVEYRRVEVEVTDRS
jgi:hypothetical protein